VSLAFVEKFRSEGKVRGGTVVGPVEGRVAIIVDDLISSGTTLAMGATACRERGATAVYAAATHGVFAREASRLLRDAPLERVVILDTISPDRLDADVLARRVQVLDCAPLLAAAIARLHTNGSLVELDL
jgi:ribose-phosphate pyrophosphokinase